MKKIILSSLTIAVLFGNSLVASAQTSTVTQMQALIESLKQQITQLQLKAETQKKATTEVREAAQDVKETLSLIRQLRQGMSGEDVKTLQIILAADPEIFPEGKITGFFGTLTSNAVKRFQKKHGLSQVGNVGQKTLEKLNKELGKNQLGEEKDERGNKQACAIVPPGHLIAPGWLKKNAKPVIPTCQILPPGIAKKLATSTPPTPIPDTMAPVISGVSATGTIMNAATITWNTNESADSVVWYSATNPVSATGTTPMISFASLATGHNLALSGLTSATTYYFVVTSKDAAGNQAVSAQFMFATQAAPDITAPSLSGISVTNASSSSVHIVWTTNEAATSKVWYSTATPVLATGTTPMVSSNSYITSHDLTLSGLSATTTYYFVVESSDAAGNKAISSGLSFATTN